MRCENERYAFENAVFFYDENIRTLQPVFQCKDKVENLQIHIKHSILVYVENLKVSFKEKLPNSDSIIGFDFGH